MSDLDGIEDNALALPGYHILSRQETEHDIRFTVEFTPNNLACYQCGSLAPLYRHGTLTQIVMDLPIRGKRVGLAVKAQRYKCRDCGQTSMQSLAFVDPKRAATSRLIEYISTESLKRTFTSIANDVGVTEATVRSIFKDHVHYLESTIHFETPEWLGLDELKLMKKMRGIVTNVKDRTVIELLPKRDMPLVIRYLQSLPNKKRIQVVTMDMWNPYRQSVREVLPQAQIVVDKFHVVRMANIAMDAVRKDIRRGLTDRQRRTLMHDRFILLHRRADLKERDLLKRDAWFGAFPSLNLAYDLKESFFDLWDAPARQEAEERYDAWLSGIPHELEWAYGDLVTAMTNWRSEIFAHFEYGRVTNAYTEAVNGLAKLIARNGRGYSFEAIRAKVLYGNGLKMSARPKYDRRKVWAFDPSMLTNPQPESEQYSTLGNEISTLSRHLEVSGL